MSINTAAATTGPAAGRIRRFTPFRIIEHWMHAAVFLVLVVTGLSQKFHAYDLSQWIVLRLGGIDMARLIHRAAGLVLTLLFVQHVVIAAVGIIRLKWQASMVIQMKDYQDAIANLRYYFGLRSHPASCDRYDYKQKFDYWGVLVSDIIMIGSGLILWLPITTTRLLYGEFVPAANVVHTNQSLLVILLIAIWHIYNSIFSPEIFPLDTSIINGYISKERMSREHPVELARRDRKPRAQPGEPVAAVRER